MALRKTIKRLHRDESGQAIVFAAITMLFVVIAVIMIFQAGVLVDRRVQAQNAADAAAYSGAATKAMCVNSIEWLNDGMAYIYSRMLWYAYDEMYFSAASFTDEKVDMQNFDKAHANSSEWIERGMRWMERIGQMEEGIANATPRLIEEEVHRVARLNGARAVTLWPNWPEYEAFISRDDHLNCVFKHQGRNRWFVASNTDYLLDAGRQSLNSFEFNIHDNLFAHNGVRARDAVSLKIQTEDQRYEKKPWGDSGIFLKANGDVTHFYDGKYVLSLSLPKLGQGPSPTRVLVIDYEYEGDGTQDDVPEYVDLETLSDTQEYIDLKTLQEVGELTLPLNKSAYSYRYAHVTWVLKWLGKKGIQVDLNTVEANYGNTYVASLSKDGLYISGGFGNEAMSATYEVAGDKVAVHGSGSLSSLGSSMIYQDNREIGEGLYPPWFVEDTETRFRRRLKGGPPNIDPAFARTRHSDEFSIMIEEEGVWRNKLQNETWSAYGGADDYQSVDLARVPMPLSVSEEFFRYGINVGVWMPPEDTIPFFHNPAHGFFAVACARLGRGATAAGAMLTPPDESLLTVDLPGGAEYFQESASYSYVKTFDSASDRWSAVMTTGPQGYWRPVLVPVKGAMLEDNLSGTGFSYSTSAEMVFDKLLNSDWVNPVTGQVDDAIPELLLNIMKPEFEAMFSVGQGEEYYKVREWKSEPFEYTGEEFDDSVQH